MNVWTITTIMGYFGMFYILWLIKRELPKILKRKKEEWTVEEERKTIPKQHQNLEDIKIKKIVNEVNQEIYKENRKQMYKDNIKKGREYEMFIASHFENLGYKVKNHGIIHGKKDKGIDVIAMKNKEITLIQCKNWKADSSYKIKHKHLKEFLGNTTAFLDNNKDKAEGYTIKRLYVTSNDVLDYSAKYFLRESKLIEHKIINF